jgi:hypothetical protein
MAARGTNRKASRIVSNVETEVFEITDERVSICPYCGKPMILCVGDYGYGVYTVMNYGSKYKSTKSRFHYAGKGNVCLKAWLEDLKKKHKAKHKPKR